jgi:hypothetical protein
LAGTFISTWVWVSWENFVAKKDRQSQGKFSNWMKSFGFRLDLSVSIIFREHNFALYFIGVLERVLVHEKVDPP